MNRYLLHLTIAVFTLFVSGSLYAMNWPTENAVLVRNFGSNHRGMPVLGMVFGGGTDVLAAESGEVIFSRSKNDPASRLPSPLGAWTAVDHGDGLISIYSRYADRNMPFAETQVEKQQLIASSGISGWSAQNGFYFMLFDRRERRWINPAMLITPVLETRAPQIISVDLRNAQGITMQSRNLTQGRYTVVVNAAGGARLTQGGLTSQQYAPHRIVCSINGAEVSSLNFEAVSARDGTLMVYRNGLVPARQIYSGFPSFEAADVFLTRGQITLEIIVQDITGVSRSFVSRLIVN
ncbi:MAG: M23 family metallopeptidase [Treponema sp.]|nr:M23 family metallopeptidase [Treponema sp.]